MENFGIKEFSMCLTEKKTLQKSRINHEELFLFSCITIYETKSIEENQSNI